MLKKRQYLFEWNGLSVRPQVCRKQAQNPRLLVKGSRPIVRTHGRLYQPISHPGAFAMRLLKRVFVFRLDFEFGSQCRIKALNYKMINSQGKTLVFLCHNNPQQRSITVYVFKINI